LEELVPIFPVIFLHGRLKEQDGDGCPTACTTVRAAELQSPTLLAEILGIKSTGEAGPYHQSAAAR